MLIKNLQYLLTISSVVKPQLEPTKSVTAQSITVIGIAHETQPPQPQPPQASILNGTITGRNLSEWRQEVFLGIPYAQPPLGDLRWSLPRSAGPKVNESKVYDDYSPFCPGFGADQAAYNMSEDCLTINVIRPAGPRRPSLPVAVWIHGGGYVRGSSADKRYNLSFIVEQSVQMNEPIIAVSFNYRLGPWGFLAGKQVKEAGITNLGLRDQRMALQWIQENIEGFGGDKAKVTIWGESAGASSVGFHIMAYGGRDDGLFRGAIMNSGSPIPILQFKNQYEYEPNFQTLMTNFNCSEQESQLECLRRTDFTTVNKTFGALGEFDRDFWYPAYDGDILQERPSEQLRTGNFTKVPIILGTNTDEGATFAIRPGPNNDTENRGYMAFSMKPPPDRYGYLLDDLELAYPNDPCFGIPFLTNEEPFCGTLENITEAGKGFLSQYRRHAAFYGDAEFIANHRLTCERWNEHGLQAYCYRFNAQSAGQHWWDGVKHLTDVAFFFYNTLGVGYDEAHNATQGINPFEGKPKEYYELSRLMSRSLVSFVSALDPNAFRSVYDEFEGLSMWPVYGKDGPMQLLLDADLGTRTEKDDYREEGIKLINYNTDAWGR